jgi:predicted RNA-binding Zn-ribbon protein involved in translation (DUF1610 family)
MSKNKVQFQVGYSLIELLKNYGSETQCVKALFKWRWPAGFRCPQCGSGRHSVLKTRNLYQCMDCHHQTSLISGTIFEQTQLPLTTWFLAIQNRVVSFGAQAANWRIVQHRLEYETQNHAGDERMRRQQALERDCPIR